MTKCSTGSTELDGKNHHSSWIKTSTFKKYYCYEYLYCLYHIANIHPTHTSWKKSVKNLKVGDKMKQNEWGVQEICNEKERGVGVRALPNFFGTIKRCIFGHNKDFSPPNAVPQTNVLQSHLTISVKILGENIAQSWIILVLLQYCSALFRHSEFSCLTSQTKCSEQQITNRTASKGPVRLRKLIFTTTSSHEGLQEP